MAENEDIGGVSIGVNVDLGQLEEQFAKAEAICKASGQTMGDAIAGAFEKGADSVASAVQQIISAAEAEQSAMQKLSGAATEAAAQLSLFDEAAHVDFSDAVGQLNMFATELEPIAATTQQAAKGIAEFGSAADLAARPIGSTVVASNELAESANKAADAGKNAGSSWEGFGSTLLGLAGISLTIGALKELVIGSIEVSDKIGDTEQSLTRLTGSAEQAATMMQRLRALADDDGLSFPSLLTAVTRLETLLPTGADVVGVMGELANVSETLGSSIEAAGQKFSSIVDSGNASTKALAGLGLTIGDIKNAMDELGISADRSFKSLSQGERFDVLTTALQKFDGAAKELNDDIGGDWTRAMNAAKDAMKNLGDAIGDGEHKFSIFSTTVKVVEGVTLSLLAGLKVLVDGVVGGSTVVVEAIKGMATAWADLAKGIIDVSAGNFTGAFDNFKNATKDASTAFDNIKAASTFTIDSIKKDWTDGTNALDKAFATTKTGAVEAAAGVAKLGDTFDGLPGKAEKLTTFAKPIREFIDIAALAAAGMLTFQASTEKAWEKVGLLASSQQRINELLAVQKILFDAGVISAAEYNKTLDTAKKITDEYGKALDAVNKIAKELQEGVWSKNIKAGIDAAADSLKGFTAEALKAPQPMSDLNRAMIDFGIGAGKAKTAVQDLHTPVETLVNDLISLAATAQASGDWTPVIQALDEFDKRIATLSKTDLPEAARQMEVFIQGMINMNAPAELVQGQLIKLESIVDKMGKEGLPQAANAMKGYLDLLKQVPTTVGDIISKQELQVQKDQQLVDLLMRRKDAIGAVLETQKQLYQDEIRLGELQGKNVEEAIYGLEKTKLGLESNKIATHGLADEYVKMIEIVNKGFDEIGKSIADCIIDQKNFGEAMLATLKNIAKEILETVIEGALKPLKKELIDLEQKWLDSVTKTTKGVKDLSGAADEAAKAQKGLGSAATQAAQAVSQLASTITLITGIISAGAAVASTIILSHISSDTGHIEVNTRGQLAEALNLRADLWAQHNELYFQGIGGIWTKLDKILDAIVNSSSGPGGLPDAALTNLAALPAILAAVQPLNSSVISLLSGSNMQVLGLQNINSTLFTIHDDLGVAIGKLDTIITSLLYGNLNSQQANRAQMDSFSSFSLSATNVGHGIIGAIGEDTAENARGGDLQVQAAETARAAAARAYASATSMTQQLAALQAQVAADNQLAAALERSGNATLAQTYRQEAAMLQQDVRALIPQIGTVNSSINSLANLQVAADLNNGAYIANSATQIVGAVYGAASVVAAAVGSAIAATGGYVSTPGTTTRVPPKGTQTNVPSEESQRPGNSNSPTGNTGQTGGAPANGAGGYVTPMQAPSYAPAQTPQYAPMKNPDGSPAEGNYVPQKNQEPFNPINPFTWPSNMSQAQQDAINAAHVPSFDQGGMVPTDMLSLVHKDEMVLPPDLSQMLRRMASTPSSPGSYPTYAGSPGVSAGGGETKIYLPVTFNGVTSSRELLQMWTAEVKRIIPRATVFSS